MKKHFSVKEIIKNYSVGKIAMAGFGEIYRKIYLEILKGSFSQYGEDLIVEKLLGKDFVGVYMEIGGYHPKRLSNTYRFYKKGWRGVVVEPNPDSKELFKKVRPLDKFENIGVGNKNGVLTYYQFYIPAINTFLKIEADKRMVEGHKLKKIVKIPIKKIDEIVDKKINYLSVDTEGYDEQILKAWPWSKFRPKVICCEDGNKRLEKYLIEKGYRLYKKTKSNSIFFEK